MKMNYFKKWGFAAALALGVSGAGAQVTEGTEYFLHLDGSDLYLSAETAKAGSNSELSLNNVLSEGYAQAFVFTAAEGGYNVTVGGAFTVVRDQWYMHYKNTSEVTLTGNDAIFAVEESGNGIRLKNLGTGKYVGADSRNDGSHVYSDKDGDNVCVFIPESKEAVYKPALENLIKEAQDLLDTTEEGTEVGQYPADARQSLINHIDAANAAVETATPDELQATYNTLKEAVTTYKNSIIRPAFTSGRYKLYHPATGENNLLASGWHANSWDKDNAENTALIIPENSLGGYNGEFKIFKTSDKADAQGYNIVDLNDNLLVNNNGKLLVQTVDKNTESDDAIQAKYNNINAVYTIEPLGNDQLRIRSAATGKTVGPNDNTKGWSWIHAGTNHTGTDDGDIFRGVMLEDLSGVEGITAESAISVAAVGGTLIVEGADNAAVYSLSGACVATVIGDSTVALHPGVYVVVANGGNATKSLKVIIK